MSSRNGFAIWITGVPASGKSTITRELVKKLEARGLRTLVLESDVMRAILTPNASYSDEERNAFYRSMAMIGEVIVRSGTNVIFDATGNKRAYRDYARSLIPNFMEVYVLCPIDICMNRDPKGIYGRASAGKTTTVPGLQVAYEPPRNPEVILDGQSNAEAGSEIIVDHLKQLLYI